VSPTTRDEVTYNTLRTDVPREDYYREVGLCLAIVGDSSSLPQSTTAAATRMRADPELLYKFLSQHRSGVLSSTGPLGSPQSARVGIAVTPQLEIIFDMTWFLRHASTAT
jgi:hypothetical protein